MNYNYVFRLIAVTDDKTECAQFDPSLLASFVMGAQPHSPVRTVMRWTTVR